MELKPFGIAYLPTTFVVANFQQPRTAQGARQFAADRNAEAKRQHEADERQREKDRQEAAALAAKIASYGRFNHSGSRIAASAQSTGRSTAAAGWKRAFTIVNGREGGR